LLFHGFTSLDSLVIPVELIELVELEAVDTPEFELAVMA
jgi:hypothetical protein